MKRLPLWLCLLPLGPLAYQNLLVPVSNLPGLPVTEAGVAMFTGAFSLLHSSYVFGWRSTLVMFGITAVVSWSFEQIGVATGAVYGVYHYGTALGPKLGHVPFAIPLSWFSMLYLAHAIGLLITEGPVRQARPALGAVLWHAFVTGMVLTAWDVLIDPLASGPSALSWVWEQGGAFYGVPNQNFFGWVMTAFTVMLLFRLYERFFPGRPRGTPSAGVLALPVIVYASIAVQLMLRRDAPTEWSVLAAFVMGFPVLAALSRLFTQPAVVREEVAC